MSNEKLGQLTPPIFSLRVCDADCFHQRTVLSLALSILPRPKWSNSSMLDAVVTQEVLKSIGTNWEPLSLRREYGKPSRPKIPSSTLTRAGLRGGATGPIAPGPPLQGGPP